MVIFENAAPAPEERRLTCSGIPWAANTPTDAAPARSADGGMPVS